MNGNIQIVIGSWGSYNECNERALGSEWLDLSEFYDWEEIVAELKKEGFELDGIDEELFIQDIEGIPSDCCNWDYTNPETLFETLKESGILDNDYKYKVFCAFLEIRDFDDFERKVEERGEYWDCGLDTRVPMVGFPYHAADIYISKIIERGHTIAVCERLDEIKLLPEPKPQEVDEETGEILSYEEMKEFDGDITEPPHLSEDLPAQNETDVENTLLEEEKAFAEAFDPEAVCSLADLLGDCFILV